MPRIIESIVSTMTQAGVMNYAPMGARFTDDGNLSLTVFHSSTTYSNLIRNSGGVLNITTDVLLFVKTALYDHVPESSMAGNGKGGIINDADEAQEFTIESSEDLGGKTRFICKISATSQPKTPEVGIIRATGSVIEALVMATRVGIIPSSEIEYTLKRSRTIVDKTGGPKELEAMSLVEKYYKSAKQGSK